MKSCSKWQLYVILDLCACTGRSWIKLAEAAISGGADALQLRDKQGSTSSLMDAAKRILPLARRARIPLIINDKADVAFAVGADGVHLGQEDLPTNAARRLLGKHRIIGRSTHNLQQAKQASSEEVNYIGFGPIFSTPTKPSYKEVGLSLIQTVMDHVKIPVVCIGGIDEKNLPAVLESGARCVAVVRAVCAAANPKTATRKLKRIVSEFNPTDTGTGI
ncbi:MAG: thiamine phosphate synthase [Candidatus Omnitrophica bacterium]|nr:thiamine phosphate synthase [Candidatus Omnitrophota bacterium]MBI3009403.1 thiamine phosphate synthase [Candidatus Omnitrophota bacterium]